MTLTLQTLKDHGLGIAGWRSFTKTIGIDLKTELSIGDVLISNGLDDALWCLRCLEPRQRVAAVMPAVKRASVYNDDQHVHDHIAAIERWLAGDDTIDLEAAVEAASLAEQAAEAARSAAEKAAWEAWAAGAAWWVSLKAERKLQEADLLAMFPPMILRGQGDA